MIYTSKAEILRMMWKSSSDVRLVDRMVGRGQIKKVEGWYEVNENFFIHRLNEYDKFMTNTDNNLDNKSSSNYDKFMTNTSINWHIQIQEDEYINLQRSKKWVKLLDRGYRDIIEKLIQYKKKEEKEEILEQIKEMKQWVSREIDK